MKPEKEVDIAIETTALIVSSPEHHNISPPSFHDIPRDSAVSKSSSIDEKSGELEISCNLFKSFVGIGILSLSYGMKEAGIILANLLIILCSFLTFWSISVCVKVVDHMNVKVVSFSDLCYLVTGRWGFITARFCVVVLQVGVCAVYCSFFGIFFNNVFCYAGIQSLCTYFGLDLLLCLLIIIPLSLVKNLTNYNRFSLLANVFVVTVLLVFFAKSCQRISSDGLVGHDMFIFEKFPFIFGISIFVIECIGIVFEMRDSMKEPHKFQSVLIKNFVIATAIYTILPTIYYLSFGDSVKELIIFNIPIENPLGMAVQILYAIALCISYPLQLFPVFIIIESLVSTPEKENLLLLDKTAHNKRKTLNKIKIYLARLFIVCVIVVISWCIPGIAVFINLLGAFGSTTLGMLFPVMIGEIYLYRNKDYKGYPLYSRIINWISLTVGMIGGGLAITFSIMKIAHGS